MAGTFDKKFRAFNSDSGEVAWEHTLNAGGFATPSTYEVEGKQYVVIAAGGGKGDTNSSDEFVVFALA
jgi:quinoprotein glucose dehydrogenase